MELYFAGAELGNLHSEMINCHSDWAVVRLFRFEEHIYGLVQPVKRLKIFKMAQRIILQTIQNVINEKEKISEQIEMNHVANSIKKQIIDKHNLQKKLGIKKNQSQLGNRSKHGARKGLKGKKRKQTRKRKFKAKSGMLRDRKAKHSDSKIGKIKKLTPEIGYCLVPKLKNKPKSQNIKSIIMSSIKSELRSKHMKVAEHKIKTVKPNHSENLNFGNTKTLRVNKQFPSPGDPLKFRVTKPDTSISKAKLPLNSQLDDEEEDNYFFGTTSLKLDLRNSKRNSGGSHLRILSGASDFSKGISMNSNISKIRVLSGVSEGSEIANLNNLLRKNSKSNFITEESSEKYQSNGTDDIELRLDLDDSSKHSSQDIVRIESKLQKKGFLEESDIELSQMDKHHEPGDDSKPNSNNNSRNSSLNFREFPRSVKSSHRKRKSKAVYNSRRKLKGLDISELEDVFVPFFVAHLPKNTAADKENEAWGRESGGSYRSEDSSLISSNEELRLLEDAERMIQEMGTGRLNVKDLMSLAPGSAKKTKGMMLDSRISSNHPVFESGHLPQNMLEQSTKRANESMGKLTPLKTPGKEQKICDIKVNSLSGSDCSSNNSYPADNYDHEAILFRRKHGNNRLQGSQNLSDTFNSSKTQSFREIERNYNNLMQNVRKNSLSQNFSILTSVQNNETLGKNSLDKMSEDQPNQGSHSKQFKNDTNNNKGTKTFCSQRVIHSSINRKK